ncbi:MAG TPA: lysophospholipase [Bacilli bacterium]|jgi:alpha-beta hydrolase superfamily lysophospholipase|nr:lysophospholipase [Bacilli bacterium]NLT01951.1 alpha/beta hydrolase [Acholeplasmataceae bacterium]HOR17613.1 lysophospholipase [Bacilli bacterium]HPL55122.1 lysophospholipase [Bacilli bacterium]
MNESVKQVAVSYNLSNDGNIKGYKWFKEGQPFKGAFLISHGMAEHIERYDEFARELAEHNYIVYGHNQRGHKDTILSKQDYGYMGENNNFEIMVTDLSEICDVIKEEHPELPIILFGHSMGSFVSQRFAQLYGNKINGLIITGSSQNSNLLLSVGLLIARIICKLKGRRYRSNLLNDLSFKSFNKVFKPNRTEFDWLNRDEKEVDKYVADPYCGGIFSAAYFKDFFKALKDINANFELVRKDLPLLILSGGNDPVGGCGKGVTKLYQTYVKKQMSDLTFKLYDQARHEILLELCKEEVKQDIFNWLANH